MLSVAVFKHVSRNAWFGCKVCYEDGLLDAICSRCYKKLESAWIEIDAIKQKAGDRYRTLLQEARFKQCRNPQSLPWSLRVKRLVGDHVEPQLQSRCSLQLIVKVNYVHAYTLLNCRHQCCKSQAFIPVHIIIRHVDEQWAQYPSPSQSLSSSAEHRVPALSLTLSSAAKHYAPSLSQSLSSAELHAPALPQSLSSAAEHHPPSLPQSLSSAELHTLPSLSQSLSSAVAHVPDLPQSMSSAAECRLPALSQSVYPVATPSSLDLFPSPPLRAVSRPYLPVTAIRPAA